MLTQSETTAPCTCGCSSPVSGWIRTLGPGTAPRPHGCRTCRCKLLRERERERACTSRASDAVTAPAAAAWRGVISLFPLSGGVRAPFETPARRQFRPVAARPRPRKVARTLAMRGLHAPKPPTSQLQSTNDDHVSEDVVLAHLVEGLGERGLGTTAGIEGVAGADGDEGLAVVSVVVRRHTHTHCVCVCVCVCAAILRLLRARRLR